MSLHARQVAMAAGAQGHDIDRIAQAMIGRQTIRIDYAESLLTE